MKLTAHRTRQERSQTEDSKLHSTGPFVTKNELSCVLRAWVPTAFGHIARGEVSLSDDRPSGYRTKAHTHA